MTEYERSRTMPAQPEHVFDQAANIDQMSERLPAPLHVHADELPAVTVHEDRTDEDTSALLRAERDQMRRGRPDPAHRPGPDLTPAISRNTREDS